ncbi:MAG: OmpA family protein [Calditrichia bacterium]
MNRTVLLLVGILAFLILGYICIYSNGHPEEIQSDLLARSSEALQTENISAVALTADAVDQASPASAGTMRLVMDGRDATLEGWAGSKAIANKAAETISAVYGINNVTNNLKIGGEVDLDFLAKLRSMVNSDAFANISGLSDEDLASFRSLKDTDLLEKLRATADGDMLAKLKDMSDLEFLKLFPFAVSSLSDRWKTMPDISLMDKLKSLSGIDLIKTLKELSAKELIRLKGLPDSDLLAGLRSLFNANFLSRLRDLFSSRLKIEAPELSEDGQKAQLAFNEALKGKRIQFETASSVIRPVSYPIIEEIIAILSRYPEMNLEVGGHTDSRGKNVSNLQLSKERAEAVQSYMTNKGVKTNRLAAKGFGHKRPIASNASAAGRKLNRRVEFKVLEVN